MMTNKILVQTLAKPIESVKQVNGNEVMITTLSDAIINKIRNIMNCVETGNSVANCDITVEPDGPGGIQQGTLGDGLDEYSDDWKLLFTKYTQSNGLYSSFFVSYLSKIGQQPSLTYDSVFMDTLKKAINDPIFFQCYLTIFYDEYWTPAVTWFNNNGFQLPLSMTIIYDSFVQSGCIFPSLRNQFPEKVPSNGGDEKTWIIQYSNTRLNWLESSALQDVRISSYRMKGYLQQIQNNNWNLDGTICINGCCVD